MPVATFDFSRPVNKKLAASLDRRLHRLRQMRECDAVDQARASFEAITPTGKSHLGDALRLRVGFVYQPTPAPSGGSDRQAPPRNERPPATRISTSRGLALRLELVAIAATQSRFRAGTEFRNMRRLRPSTTTSSDGWVDLLATPTKRAGRGRTSSGILDKKLRQFRTARTTLEGAGIVELPNRDRPVGAYEDFQLLHEPGRRRTGPALPYEVPRAGDAILALPATLITNGWIHVLEDSELALLMMVAAAIGNLPNQDGKVAIPSDTRLLHYGISRHTFADAHVVLALLNLLDVEEVGRHEGGRAVDFENEGADLHRLQIQSDGFKQEALPTAIQQIETALARVR